MNKFNVTSAKISTTPHDARWPPRRCGDARWRLGRQVELELLHQKLLVGVAAARPSSVFVEIIRGDLNDGEHPNPTNNPQYFTFTTAFFHSPDEPRSEVEQSGFSIEKIPAIEGPAMWIGMTARLSPKLSLQPDV